jgi:hypothetical protein
VTQERVEWRAVVYTIMKDRVQYKAIYSLTRSRDSSVVWYWATG